MSAERESLEVLRREIDLVDDEMHSLLMRRAELVRRIGVLKGGAELAYRPSREAQIVRRLVRGHTGALPKAELALVWRQLLGATARLQTDFAIAVLARDGTPGPYWEIARGHYGGGATLVEYGSPNQVVVSVAGGTASVGLLPLPQEDDEEPWWPKLLQTSVGAPKVVARLPFVPPAKQRTSALEALVVMNAPVEPSGEDRSLIVLDCEGQSSRAAMTAALRADDLEPALHLVWDDPDRAGIRLHLLDAEGFIEPDIGRFATIGEHAGTRVESVVRLGAYAAPLAPEELT